MQTPQADHSFKKSSHASSMRADNETLISMNEQEHEPILMVAGLSLSWTFICCFFSSIALELAQELLSLPAFMLSFALGFIFISKKSEWAVTRRGFHYMFVATIILVVFFLLSQAVLLLIGYSAALVHLASFAIGFASAWLLLTWLADTKRLPARNLKRIICISALIGVIFFALILWLYLPIQIILFLLLSPLSLVLLMIKEYQDRASGIRSHEAESLVLISYQNQREPSAQVKLTFKVPLMLFAYSLSMGFGYYYSFSFGNRLVVSIACVFIVFCICLVIFIRRGSFIDFGEVSRVCLTVCIISLFLLPFAKGIFLFAVGIACAATLLFISLCNLPWLIYLAKTCSLEPYYYVTKGRWFANLGIAIGFVLGYVLLQTNQSEALFAITLICLIFATVVTSSLLPLSKGTPVEHGLFVGNGEDSDNRLINQQKKSYFKEICAKTATAYNLTSREYDVFKLLVRGYNAETISEILFISLNTTKSHIYNIYKKADIHSQQELIISVFPLH